jgi:adenylate kinase family enzyme
LAQGIPNYHTLKLAIIGKAYAGKKTHAKKIMEKYAGKL